jgi:endo-1,4-beta-xylanase
MVEAWIRLAGERYPKTAMVDVVNEPIHTPPNGSNGTANYIQALGGAGVTGWDWVIWAYQKAREYFPHAKLLINEYGVLNSTSTTNEYIKLIDTLKVRNLIDGIGCQGHFLEGTPASTISANLKSLAATGLPIYISEYDVDEANDSTQLSIYEQQFPIFWTNPDVKGITLWGYVEGHIWRTDAYLIRTDGSVRPALQWMIQYVATTAVRQMSGMVPANYVLSQNYPNPFNPTTQIDYSIAKRSYVSLEVYNVLGEKVATLFSGEEQPGNYTATFNGSSLPSGVYFYRLSAGAYTAVKKLMLIK